MSGDLPKRLQMFGVWSGAGVFLFWLIGFGAVAQWIPPPSPSAGPEAIADLYREHSMQIRVGMIFVLFGATFYLPWTMLLADFIRRIEGNSYFLSGTQFAAGLMSAVTFFIPSFLWACASFRPERDPNVVQGISDVAWLIFITGWPPFVLQYLCLAVAIFADKRPVPSFPRWAGYLQILISLSFVPASLALFFKTGPFAWNGIFVWWIPLTLFSVWFVAMFFLARAMVRRNSLADPIAS